MRWPLGVMFLVYGMGPLREIAIRAREDGFLHLDALEDTPDDLALPIGNRNARERARPGCTLGALPRGEGAWEKTRRIFQRTPGALLEPWAGSCTESVAAVRAMLEEVPGLRITLDTGHVASWGEDPVELADAAGHVQLRQARKGVAQCVEGDVDFARLFRRLDALDYRGLLSIEYFDLPDRGWALADPRAHALALAERIRPLL